MVKLAVDAMGGDHAPQEIVRGAVAALQARKDLKLLLVGRRDQVEEALSGLTYPPGQLSLIHADEVIGGSDNPGLAIRRKRKSSMVTALQLVRSGRADAVLSAGNTGALMAGALLFLGRLPKVDRPALLTVMPGFTGAPFVVLDVGANMDARPEQLVQYAFMGRIYAQKLLNCHSPRVALLNVGTELNKGNSQVKKAFSLIQEYVPGFCGNIEGTDLFFQRRRRRGLRRFCREYPVENFRGASPGDHGPIKEGANPYSAQSCRRRSPAAGFREAA